jgi:hypothetical protein
MERQSKIIVDNVMARNLSIRNFYDIGENFRNVYYPQLIEENLIGGGYTGKAFLVEGGTMVIKQSNACYTQGVLELYCNDVKKLISGENMIIIPSGDNFRYILPNFLSEAIIGAIFNEFNISINLAQTVGTYILFDNLKNPVVYFLMPRYQSIFVKNPINRQEINPVITPLGILYLLFQASTGLLAAQEIFRFTHYDLHIENVLLDNWPSGSRFLSYPIREGNLIINRKLCPFIVKIADYGLSRLQIRDVIITPTVSERPDSTFGEFNPSYDIICLVGSILIDYRFRYKFLPLLQNIELYTVLVRFALWLFNDIELVPLNYSGNFDQLEEISYSIAQKYYKKIGDNYTFRPNSQDGNLVNFRNTHSMREVVEYLSNLLLSNNMAQLADPFQNSSKVAYLTKDMIVMPNLPNITFDKVISFAPVIKNNRVPEYGKSTSSRVSMDIVPGYVHAESFHTLLSDIPSTYNFTIDERQLKNCPIQEHYMTAIFVDPNVFGYSFTSECCKLDPINFLRMSKLPGFTINGGFFNINGKDFLPIGNYKDRNLDFRNPRFPIPEEYRDVYGFVCMSQNKLYITRDFNFASIQDYMFSCGPFLIEKGEIVFSPYEERFACNIKENVKAPIEVLDETEKNITVSGYAQYSSNGKTCRMENVNDIRTFPRCDKIKPGELSHADNPNPRTAIVILRNGNYVFITVEGRGNRGIGIDLYALALMIKMNLPTAVTAINLDGGRSTNMAWRTITEPNTVYISNPNHAYQYPVGNILMFRKI